MIWVTANGRYFVILAMKSAVGFLKLSLHVATLQMNRNQSGPRVLADWPLIAKAWAELEDAKTKHQEHNLCFVAMRFLSELNPLFEAMRRACHRAGCECKRVDTDAHADHIDNRLIDMLNRCRFVIADFTFESSNVYFEAGYAFGLGKKVIWTRRAAQAVAFDANQFYFIDWQDSEWAKFEYALETSIGAVVRRLAPIA